MHHRNAPVYNPNYSVYRILLVIILMHTHANGLEVHDSVNISYQIKELAQMAEQAAHLKAQMDQAVKHYQAMTGHRKLGMILHDPDLRKMLPEDAQSIYTNTLDTAAIVSKIVGEENYTGTIKAMQDYINVRTKQQAVIDKAMASRAYTGAKRRLTKIDKLMAEIDKTNDPKSISELQARINIEQTVIQNNITKLQLISQLQRAERQLIKNQRSHMNQRILNPKNQKMPQIARKP